MIACIYTILPPPFIYSRVRNRKRAPFDGLGRLDFSFLLSRMRTIFLSVVCFQFDSGGAQRKKNNDWMLAPLLLLELLLLHAEEGSQSVSQPNENVCISSLMINHASQLLALWPPPFFKSLSVLKIWKCIGKQIWHWYHTAKEEGSLCLEAYI